MFVVADIPGLIEGASEGVGLGYEFLRHVQRCRFFLHVVDMSAQDPIENYNKINSELKKYDEELSKRHQVLVLNKSDIVEQEKIDELVSEFKKLNSDLFVVSCASNIGIKELLSRLYVLVEEIEKFQIEVEVEHDFECDNNDDSAFEINKLNKNTYFVSGGKLKRLVSVTDIKNTHQVRRLSNIMDSMGVWEALRKSGIQNEDTVVVEGMEMIYFDGYFDD